MTRLLDTTGPARPALHLTPERGWMNDPHAVIHREGLYHVFYQVNPGATHWTPGIQWGHATSPDLGTWTNHAPVLAPGDGDDGIWTGCAVDGPDGTPVIFYTSAHGPDPDLARIRTAHPTDPGLMSWRKGPVVAEPPPGVVTFRDPSIRREDDRWRMFVGAGLADGRPAVVSYTSDDLERWEYAGIVAAGQPGEPWTGSAWECPQLVTFGERTVLLVSVWEAGQTHHVAAAVGTYADGRLTLDHWQDVGHGTGHYAPTTFLDADGQPCVLFWIREIADGTGTWRGALSVPYRLRLVDDRPRFRPHPAVVAALGDRFVEWTPEERDALVVPAAGGGDLFRIDARDGLLTVRAGDHAVTLPGPVGEPVQVIADGGVLEVCTGPGLVGLPLGGRAA